jgi:small subunit ribosomal protein S5
MTDKEKKEEEKIKQKQKQEDNNEDDNFEESDIDEEKVERERVEKHVQDMLAKWTPRTDLGRKIKAGEINDIDEIFASGKRILEVGIIDTQLPTLESDLLMIGQSKGKFGGGARRVFKQTQKKTKEGNKPSFATMAVVGNRDGYVGVGYAKAKETVPAREKALRRAKLNIFPIKRGSGSWLSSTNESHSIPFAVTGKCGSTKITLMPAPVGKGLIIEKECRKILELAGIKDIWSKTTGQTGTKLNLLIACVNALKKLNKYKISDKKAREMSIVTGNKRVK